MANYNQVFTFEYIQIANNSVKSVDKTRITKLWKAIEHIFAQKEHEPLQEHIHLRFCFWN